MASPAFLPPPATVGGARRGAAASAAVSTSTAPTQGLPAVARRPHRPACLRMAADEGAGEAPAPIDMDAAFVRLGHKNEVMRKRVRCAGGRATVDCGTGAGRLRGGRPRARAGVGRLRAWWTPAGAPVS